MKTHLLDPVVLALVCLAANIAPLKGQVILNSNSISGTVRFTNTNPAILSLLKAPGNEGMSNILVTADSLPPAPALHAVTDQLPVTSRTSAVYQITVEAGSPGIAYVVVPNVIMEGTLY